MRNAVNKKVENALLSRKHQIENETLGLENDAKKETLSHEGSCQTNVDSRHAGSTKFVKKNSFRQLF